MITKGVDYSFGRPGGAAIADAGFTFAMRYVPYFGDGGKGLREEEVADLRANGLDIGLVFESTAGRMFDGYPAGAEDARVCVQSAASIGFPADRPIYFACDVDTEPAMLALVDDYLRGAAGVLGPTMIGVYGEYEVVAHCQANHTAAWLWQTYAWSGGQWLSGIHVYQHLNGQTLNGAAVDYNQAYYKDFGQWKGQDNMADPRVDALIAAMGGQAAIDAWNGPPAALTGNSLLIGYAEEQAKLAKDIADHLATPGNDADIPEHDHTGGTSGPVKR